MYGENQSCTKQNEKKTLFSLANQSKICDFDHGLATSLCPWDNVEGVDDVDWTLSDIYATGSTFGKTVFLLVAAANARTDLAFLWTDIF